jgi:hypothetical protein
MVFGSKNKKGKISPPGNKSKIQENPYKMLSRVGSWGLEDVQKNKKPAFGSGPR